MFDSKPYSYHSLNVISSHLFFFIISSTTFVLLPPFLSRIFLLATLLAIDLSLSFHFSTYNISFPYFTLCYFQNPKQNHIPLDLKIIQISLFLNFICYFLTWPSRVDMICSLPTSSALSYIL